jgi:hypothetical protein
VTSAGDVALADGGAIASQTQGPGAGGDVTIDVSGPLTLEGAFAAISADALPNSSGDGGRITVNAAELSVRGQSFLSANTRGSGAGGDVNVTVAGHVELDGQGAGADEFSGIRANSQNVAGTAGSVSLSARSLTIREGAGIATQAAGGASGTGITLDIAGSLIIDARATGEQTGLTASSLSPGATGGGIVVGAASVEMHRGQIIANAEGSGGEIDIQAPQFVHLFDNSQVLAEAVAGTGGNVTIDPESVVLRASRITANARQGAGGNVTIRADAFIPSSDPDTAVTASSEIGLVGTVEINAPDTEIAGALVNLPGALASGASLLPQCGANLTGNVSSFVATGRGGVPPVPGGWSPAYAPAASE